MCSWTTVYCVGGLEEVEGGGECLLLQWHFPLCSSLKLQLRQGRFSFCWSDHTWPHLTTDNHRDGGPRGHELYCQGLCRRSSSLSHSQRRYFKVWCENILDSDDSDNEGGLGNVERVVMRPPGHSGKAKKGHLCFDAIYETGEIWVTSTLWNW